MPRRPTLRGVLWLAPFAALLAVFFTFLTATYPRLGHDYESFFRFLIAGRWHFAQYGLAPLRYAVHLCGGLPLYGHPNDLSYSLTQALALVLNPWHASLAAFFALLIAGYFGWYRLGRDVFRLDTGWAHALALIVAAHGFHLMHAVIGHMNFATTPLIGWMLWLLYSRDTKRFTPVLRAAIFALLAAAVLHAAGYFTLIFFIIAAAVLLPPLLWCREHVDAVAPHDFPMRAGGLAAAASLLMGSKLIAILSLMRTFPREVIASAFTPQTEPLSVAVKSLWFMPQAPWLFGGVPWGLHENSHFLSPAVLAGAMIGVTLLLAAAYCRRRHALFLLLYALATVLLCLLLIRGHGMVVDMFKSLPFLKSLRVMMRLLYPFSLPLAIGSVFAMQHAVARRTAGFRRRSVWAVLAVTVCAVSLAYGPVMKWADLRNPPAIVLRQAEEARAKGFTDMPVTQVINRDSDFLGASGMQCSGDALFLSVGWQQVPGLRAGPVTDIHDGAFNLNNPACFAYGAENACRPGSRISVSDEANLRAFTTGGPLTWKVSTTQFAADWISLLSLLACACVVIWHAAGAARPVRSGR